MCCLSQSDTTTSTSVFKRIAGEMANFKVDTTEPPNDKTTSKIIELLKIGGAFNITEAIEFKIAEDRSKNEITEEKKRELERFFAEGDGHKKLQNSIVWIYRNHFSYTELKSLVRFYKSSAGRKLTSQFPIIMLKSLTAAQQIKESK